PAQRHPHLHDPPLRDEPQFVHADLPDDRWRPGGGDDDLDHRGLCARLPHPELRPGLGLRRHPLPDHGRPRLLLCPCPQRGPRGRADHMSTSEPINRAVAGVDAPARRAAAPATAAGSRAVKVRRKRRRITGYDILAIVFMIFMLAFALIPMAWMLSTSLK